MVFGNSIIKVDVKPKQVAYNSLVQHLALLLVLIGKRIGTGIDQEYSSSWVRKGKNSAGEKQGNWGKKGQRTEENGKKVVRGVEGNGGEV